MGRHKAAPASDPDDAKHESRIAELAAMSPLKYQRERQAAAMEIGIKVGVLDFLVKDQRKINGAGSTHPAHWQVEPWPDPVDGAALLDAVADVFERYAVLPEHAAVALVLWVAFAWALELIPVLPVRRAGLADEALRQVAGADHSQVAGAA